MKNQIIVDSCCDMTPEMKAEMGIITIPFTMILGGNEFLDNETLDIHTFMEKLKQFSGKPGSASPPPYLYQEAIEKSENAYVVTLSSKLSGSFSNAVISNNEAFENGLGTACVFDSKSASAGEALIAIKIHELIRSGMPKERIRESIYQFIDRMKTYFVLDNYDNLRKNGRLNRVTGTLVQMLNIKLIMGADGNGEIALFEKARGIKGMMQQLLSLIEKSGKETRNENLVISHCNNHSLAEQLRELIKGQFHFKNIYVVPTGGLSSLYVDNRGIVMAF